MKAGAAKAGAKKRSPATSTRSAKAAGSAAADSGSEEASIGGASAAAASATESSATEAPDVDATPAKRAPSGAAKAPRARAGSPRTRATTAKPAGATESAAAAAGEAEPAEPATSSKRTPASRTASKTASSARGRAAKSTRTTAEKGAATSATARARAAESTSAKKRPTPRAAAALTTDTTAAERPRKAEPSGDPEYLVDELPFPDEQVAPAEPLAEAAAAAAAAEAASDAPATRAEPAPAAEATTVAEPTEATSSAASTPPAEPDGLAELLDQPVPAEAEPASEVESDSGQAPAEATRDQAVAVVAAPPKKPAPRKKRTLRVARQAPGADVPAVLEVDGLVKRFGANTAVDRISLEVRAGSFFGVVGPNGAGKTTTLSMITGLLRPDEGTVRIHGIDVWADPKAAKRATGVLPDRLRLFDRLTGAQLLDYSGTLRGLDHQTVRERAADLAAAFGLEDALGRLVADYSAGMTKKIALACAMIHSPRLLVLDEPFESVDPVSAANLTEILERYVAGGGTVVLSSHGMDLIERVCDSAAIVVGGHVLAHGTLDEVRQGQTLEDRFVELAGGRKAAEGMEWLHSFVD